MALVLPMLAATVRATACTSTSHLLIGASFFLSFDKKVEPQEGHEGVAG